MPAAKVAKGTFTVQVVPAVTAPVQVLPLARVKSRVGAVDEHPRSTKRQVGIDIEVEGQPFAARRRRRLAGGAGSHVIELKDTVCTLTERPSLGSATNIFPAVSTATPKGEFNQRSAGLSVARPRRCPRQFHLTIMAAITEEDVPCDAHGNSSGGIQPADRQVRPRSVARRSLR